MCYDNFQVFFFDIKVVDVVNWNIQLIAKTRPQNPFGEEGVLIVATPSQKVLTYASPGLEPLVKTSEGKKLISVLLSSTTHQSENQK
jgi:hypothetical protein